MYESFFDLTARPFPAAPVVQHYFPTAALEQARQTLIRIVDRAEGPGLIIGQPGLGKTLLLRMLQHHFQNVFHGVHLAGAAIESRKDLLQNVLFELNLPYREMEEGELRLSLLDFLRPSESCPHGVLLLVDEAHTLPLQLLDEIRMITNLVRDGQPRVRLVLAGDTQLDDVFADPRLDSFNQRIAARCYLEPLNQEQTSEYVRAQLAASGGDPAAIFTPDSLIAVYRASGGIPRLINQVCDHALVMASVGGYHQLDAAGVEEAWADLQQLPGPFQDTAPASESGQSIVEFGALDADDADFATSHPEAPDHEVASASDAGELPDDTAYAATTDFATEEAPEQTAAPTTTFSTEFATDQNPEQTWDDQAGDNVEPSAADVEPKGASGSANAESAWTLSGQDVPTQPDPANETPVAIAQANSAASCDLAPSDLMLGFQHGDPSNAELLAGAPHERTTEIVQDGLRCDDPANSELTNERQLEPTPEPPTTELPTDPPHHALPTATTAAVQTDPAPTFVDPFGQGFEEEEVVVDRYADLGGTVFAGCPQVSSDEGRALAAIIDQQAGPQLTVVDAPALDDEPVEPQTDARDDQTGVAEEPLERTEEESRESHEELTQAAEYTAQALANNVFDTSSLSEWLFESSTDTVNVNEAEQAESPAPVAPPTPEPAPTPQAGDGPLAPADEPQPSFLQVHDGPHVNDDRDMIVIDEDSNEGVIVTQTDDDLARRVEYQQLFSQLREG